MNPSATPAHARGGKQPARRNSTGLVSYRIIENWSVLQKKTIVDMTGGTLPRKLTEADRQAAADATNKWAAMNDDMKTATVS